jgi:tungstate transport system ATP-binding protein
MSSLLEIRNLRLIRDRRLVLAIDHLNVESGQVLAVVGPNGAGKSSLLFVLAHLLKPDQGEILIDGLSSDTLHDLDYRRRIGLVLQEPLLLDTSVFDNVAIGLRFRHLSKGEITQRVETWLDRLRITHLRNRPSRKLSGGEAQRVSLARAFVLEPQLLLLDEPFSSLDTPTRARLLDDLHGLLAETSTTTILITHDFKEATRLASQVAVLLDGNLRQIGTPEEVFTSPVDAEVAAFLGNGNDLSKSTQIY